MGTGHPETSVLVLPLWAVHSGKASPTGCSFPVSDVSRLDVTFLGAPFPARNIHDFYDGPVHLTQNLIPGLIESLSFFLKTIAGPSVPAFMAAHTVRYSQRLRGNLFLPLI